jgi:hypothetical protein
MDFVMKNTVLRIATPCTLVETYQRFGRTFYLFLPIAYGGSSLFRNIRHYLPRQHGVTFYKAVLFDSCYSK